jgi:hypothetical protein
VVRLCIPAVHAENQALSAIKLVGLLHPIIHLGFGIEFNQPAIIHEDWTGPRFLFPAEQVAGGIGKPGRKTMLQLLEEAQENTKLTNSVRFEDGNKLRDGVLKRAGKDMIELAAQYTVSEEQMAEKYAEIVDVSGTLPSNPAPSILLREFVIY